MLLSDGLHKLLLLEITKLKKSMGGKAGWKLFPAILTLQSQITLLAQFLLRFDSQSLPSETLSTPLAGRATKHWEKARVAMKKG